jgi:hypothetical protein
MDDLFRHDVPSSRTPSPRLPNGIGASGAVTPRSIPHPPAALDTPRA